MGYQYSCMDSIVGLLDDIDKEAIDDKRQIDELERDNSDLNDTIRKLDETIKILAERLSKHA